jgi:hypothetical protein
MPVQRFNSAPVNRPPGLVEPQVERHGLTELRLHGVGGTTPENLLGDLAPQQVSGDRIAGFYRTADLPDRRVDGSHLPGRHVEAYSWGGLTSRSGSRVLWLLLFPFAMANVAGWMCMPKVHEMKEGEKPWRFWLHRTAVRWASLALTVNLFLLVALISMDLIGYQCGGQSACVGDRWWLSPLGASAVVGFPGRRVLEGAVVPFSVVVLLFVLTLRSLTRYEQIEPPRRIGAPTQPSTTSAAMPGRGLADRHFWDGKASVADLGQLHIAVALAFLALLVAHTVHTTSFEAGAAIHMSWLWVLALTLGAAVIAIGLVLLVLDASPRLLPSALFGVAVVAVAAAAWFAWAQPGFEAPFGPLPGMRNAANLSFLGIIVAVLLVLAPVWIGGHAKGSSFIGGPFVAITVGCVVLNLVLLGVMIRVADLLTRVSFNAANAPSGAPAKPVVYVYEVIGRSTPYLTLVPLACLLGFAIYELIGYWRAGVDPTVREDIRAWYSQHPPEEPTTEPGWHHSALTDDEVKRGGLAGLLDRVRGRGWEAGVARARRFAQMPRDLDKLLALIAGLGLLILAWAEVSIWVLERPPSATGWMLTAGSWVATALPLLVLLLLRRGWGSLESRRRLGILWDVLTFWPRAYHPLAPPSYAERAVPELQRRLWRLHESRGRVLLAAHSQGSVIAAAALLQPNCRPDDDVVTLVTFGAPLRKLYGWAFPYYFADDVLCQLADPDSRTRVLAWHNYYYDTDYIGGPAFDRQGAAGVDKQLPDPQMSWYIWGQPPPALGRHSGYWADLAMWAGDPIEETGVEYLARLTQNSPRVNRALFDPEVLERLRATPEVVLRVTRPDGSTSTRSLWVVVEAGMPYIRSLSGTDGVWYQQVRDGAKGALIVSGHEVPFDVVHVDDPQVWDRVSQAYRNKYLAQWPDWAEHFAGEATAGTTLRLRPWAP